MTTRSKTTWRTVRLGDVSELSTAQVNPRNLGDTPVDHFSIPAFDAGKIPVRERASSIQSNKFVVPKGTVLLSKLNPRVPRVWKPSVNNNTQAVASTEFMVFVPREVDRDFLFYLFQRKAFLGALAGQAGGTSTSHQRAIPSAVLDTGIAVPKDVNEQKRIAEVLVVFDDKIELNNKISRTLEQIAQEIYKEWFVNFRFPGHERIKMVDSELGKIPEGWDVKNIGSIANVVLGGTPSRLKPEYWGGKIPWINSGKVNEFRVTSASEYITEAGLKNSNARLMPKRTTVIAITGATLGQVGLLEIEASANQSVVGVFSSNVLLPEFVYLYIKERIEDLIGSATGGAQQHINKQVVEDYPVLVPDGDVLAMFANAVEPVFNQIANSIYENQKLAALRDLLLPKLMSGEVGI